jgi:5-methylcytosine-specific restriction enzyme B
VSTTTFPVWEGLLRIVWQGKGRPALYEVAQRFVKDALERDASVFSPSRRVWTLTALDDLHQRFVVGADLGEGSFEAKLEAQLAGASDEVVQLLAELLLFNLLAAADITAPKKRELVDAVLGHMAGPVVVPKELQQAFDVGIARIGSGKNHRYWQLAYLIELARRWKALAADKRHHFLSDPWAFKAFANDQESFRAGLQREAMLHLLFPDEFEPIISKPHKDQIVKTFEDLLTEPTDDVDRSLLQLRGRLTERFGPDFHFYQPEVKVLWQPAKASPWDQLARWARKILAAPDFDQHEREYKLELADDLAQVRATVSAGGDWREGLSKAVRSTNLLNWRQWEQIDAWSGEDPSAAGAALALLWDPTQPLADRITGFGEDLGRSVSGQGTRVAIASVLLMGLDVQSLPPYRPQAFSNFRALVDYPGPEMPTTDGERYEHALGFFDRVLDELAKRAVELRDRLDAQSVLWTLAQTGAEDVTSGWSDQEREAFLRWRGDLPPEDDEFLEPDATSASSAAETSGDPLAYAAQALLLPREFLARIKRLLADKPQILFYGPPGTGKTFVARTFAQAVTGDPSRVQLVQFHPSYAYEDFVEGFRPDPTTGGAGFALIDGPLKQIAGRAAADRDNTYVLIIDELNRGNVAKVFGELYFLLEYRDEQVTLQYSHQTFSLSRNLWLIGTMNTADRSIALMDAALRRRFYFQGFLPGEPPIAGLLDRWLSRHAPGLRWVAEILDRVNRQIDDPHFAVGPSYFLRKDLTTDWVEAIWEHAVLPYLEEQYFGDEDQLDRFRLTALRDDVDDDSSPAAEGEEPGVNEIGQADADADTP